MNFNIYWILINANILIRGRFSRLLSLFSKAKDRLPFLLVELIFEALQSMCVGTLTSEHHRYSFRIIKKKKRKKKSKKAWTVRQATAGCSHRALCHFSATLLHIYGMPSVVTNRFYQNRSVPPFLSSFFPAVNASRPVL